MCKGTKRTLHFFYYLMWAIVVGDIITNSDLGSILSPAEFISTTVNRSPLCWKMPTEGYSGTRIADKEGICTVISWLMKINILQIWNKWGQIKGQRRDRNFEQYTAQDQILFTHMASLVLFPSTVNVRTLKSTPDVKTAAEVDCMQAGYSQ